MSRRNAKALEAVLKMRERPLEIGVQALVSNHLKMLLSKTTVLSVKEKAEDNLSDADYGDERKRTNEDASKSSDVIKTRVGMAVLG